MQKPEAQRKCCAPAQQHLLEERMYAHATETPQRLPDNTIDIEIADSVVRILICADQAHGEFTFSHDIFKTIVQIT